MDAKFICIVTFVVIGVFVFHVFFSSLQPFSQINPSAYGIVSSNRNTSESGGQTVVTEERRTLSSNRPKVLCLILTTVWSEDRRKAVNNTWAGRCDRVIFVIGKVSVNRSDTKQLLQHENVVQVDVEDKRNLLPHKVYKAFEYAYHRYKKDYDWIMKCDDDTYVIMDNLKLFLANLSQQNPSYVGYRFKLYLKDGYMSGGAGYLISSAGLQNVFTTKNISDQYSKTGDEDVEMAKCFKAAGLKIIDSWDETGKERFHAETLGKMLYTPYAGWLNEYGWRKPVFGFGCCSPYVISFHHVTPRDMYIYEHLLYNTKVGLQKTS